MLGRIFISSTVALVILGTSAGGVRAWGVDAHRIISRIAYNLLPEKKAEMIDDMLRNSVVGRDFIEASLYADQVIRPQDSQHVFEPWHYVNWTISQSFSDMFCQPTCIVKQLPDQIEKARIFSDRDAKALATSWVIHMIGDLHQPMHMGDDRDRGGNDFPVTYRGRDRCGTATSDIDIHNLHRAWDYCLVYELEMDRDWRQVADDLRGNLSSYKGHAEAGGDHYEWGVEAHNLSRDVAYKDVRHHDDIQGEYIAPRLSMVRQQLLRAGIRLAKVLDEIL